jgi:hypothetical protein
LRIASLGHQRTSGQRDDFHEVAVAQLARDRPKMRVRAGCCCGSISTAAFLVEGDVGAVGRPKLLAGADDDRLHDLALADAALRARLFDVAVITSPTPA